MSLGFSVVGVFKQVFGMALFHFVSLFLFLSFVMLAITPLEFIGLN